MFIGVPSQAGDGTGKPLPNRRKKVRMAVMAFMGYCLNKHLYTIGLVIDSTCRICSEDENDSQHVLGKCIGQRSSAMFIGGPSPTNMGKPVQINRKKVRMAVEVFMGYCLNKHLYTMRLVNSICRICCEDEEDTQHVLGKCIDQRSSGCWWIVQVSVPRTFDCEKVPYQQDVEVYRSYNSME